MDRRRVAPRLAALPALAALAVAALLGGCTATSTRRPTVHRVAVAAPPARTVEVRTVYAYDPPPSSYWWHDGWHTYPHPGSCWCYGSPTTVYTTHTHRPTYWTYTSCDTPTYYRQRSAYVGTSYRYRTGDRYRSAPARSSGFRGRVVVGR